MVVCASQASQKVHAAARRGMVRLRIAISHGGGGWLRRHVGGGRRSRNVPPGALDGGNSSGANVLALPARMRDVLFGTMLAILLTFHPVRV